MQIRPLHDRVIVKRLETERMTASGIVLPDSAGDGLVDQLGAEVEVGMELGGVGLPDSAGEKPDQGEVLAVGPGKRDEAGKLIPMDVKVGDRVIFGKYAGQMVKFEGKEYLVMREEDIMGVLA